MTAKLAKQLLHRQLVFVVRQSDADHEHSLSVPGKSYDTRGPAFTDPPALAASHAGARRAGFENPDALPAISARVQGDRQAVPTSVATLHCDAIAPGYLSE